MLVLSRLEQESIIIGEDIVVTVVRIADNKVRLGITTPPGVPVDRTEIRRAKVRDAEALARGEYVPRATAKRKA